MKSSSILIIYILITLNLQASSKDKVLYGVDNRYEIGHSPYSHFSESIGAMINLDHYDYEDHDQEVILKNVATLSYYRGVPTCKGLRFRNQLTISSCTGFLVKKDILVTAGHCITKYKQAIKNKSNQKCKNSIWAFDFKEENTNANSVSIDKTNIKKCKRIISARYDDNLDYAIIKLEASKEDSRKPLKLSFDHRDYAIGNRVMVIGHPSGLPMKVSEGARIHKTDLHSFVSNLDTFAGNSGSPIFNNYGEVIGILNSGETDYYFNNFLKCYDVNRCERVGGKCNVMNFLSAAGESSTKITSLGYLLQGL